MSTTTVKLIREQQQALIKALAPTQHSNVPFRAYSERVPFEDWAEESKASSFRWYSIRDLFDYEDLDPSDATSVSTEATLEFLIAYPFDGRYGAQNAEDAHDLMSEDFHQIKGAIGVEGFGNYVSGQNGCWFEVPEIEEGEAVWFLRSKMRLHYRRAI